MLEEITTTARCVQSQGRTKRDKIGKQQLHLVFIFSEENWAFLRHVLLDDELLPILESR